MVAHDVEKYMDEMWFK